MRIAITNDESEFSAEIPDGSTLEGLLSEIKGLLVAVGFHPISVDQHILPNEWGLDDDEQS